MLEEAANHIYEAIELGRIDIVKKLLEEVKLTIGGSKSESGELPSYGGFLSKINGPTGTFLHEAVKQRKKDVVRALLLEGADPFAVDSNNLTSLDLAKTCEIRQVFHEVLLQAIGADNKVQVQNLLKAGLDVNNTFDTEETRNTPLIWACAFGSAEMVQMLIDPWDADVQMANSFGETPLHEAVNRNAPEIAKILLDNGADASANAFEGKFKNKSCLDIVAEKEDKLHESFACLFKAREDNHLSNHVTTKPNTPTKTRSLVSPNVNENFSLRETDFQVSGTKNLSPIPFLITDERINLLWPQPAYIQQLSSADDGINKFPKKLSLSIFPGKLSIHSVLDVWDTNKSYLSTVKRRVYLDENHPVLGEDFECSTNIIKSHIWVAIEKKQTFAQTVGSYRLTVSQNRIRISAADLSGLHYAIMTLVQLFTLFHPSPDDEQIDDERVLKIVGSNSANQQTEERTKVNDSQFSFSHNNNGIVSVHISDKPDLSIRAVLLDMNPYGRVPSLESLLQIIDDWAKLKINQFHAFIRICIASGNDQLLCYGKSDFLTIDRYCRDRFIEFVPAVDVDLTSMSSNQILEMQKNIVDILACFDKPRFIHLGPNLTNLAFSQNFGIIKFRSLIGISSSTTIMVCGNTLKSAEMMMPNTIAIQYGFQRSDSLITALSRFSWSGHAVCVCSGTAAWSNLAGSPDAALTNNMSVMKSLSKVQGIGSVIANWSSHPSFTHLVFSWPGFLVGAGLAWNANTPETYLETNLAELLDLHVLGDMTSIWRQPHIEYNESELFSPGRALLELGRAENLLDEKRQNKSSTPPSKTSSSSSDTVLLKLLVNPDDVDFEGLSIEDFGATVQRIRRAHLHLMKCATPSSYRYEVQRQEMQITAELLLLSARIGRALRTSGSQPLSRASPGKSPSSGLTVINVGIANLQSTFRTDIANKLLSIVEQYRALWLSRYQSQGLQGSLLALTSLLRKFIPNE